MSRKFKGRKDGLGQVRKDSLRQTKQVASRRRETSLRQETKTVKSAVQAVRIHNRIGIAVVAVNLVVIALLINLLSIPLLSPAYGWEGASTQPEFSWGGLQGKLGNSFIIMIDEDPGFSSAMTKEVKGNSYRSEEPLEFGTYYWKVVSPESATSPTGMFTVVSEVAVERDNGWLKNTGNSGIALEAMDTGREPGSSARPGLTGLFLGINESVEVGGEDVVATQL